MAMVVGVCGAVLAYSSLPSKIKNNERRASYWQIWRNTLSPSQALDYAAYSDLIQQLGFGLSPAECHGGLAGLLCATDTITSEQWTQELLAPRAAGAPLHMADEASAMRRLYDHTVEGHDDVDYGFALAMPDEQHPLHELAEALAQWRQGFLCGLSLGGIQVQAKLPGDVNEVMQDMSEI